jgi:hypothetical protein
MSKSVHGELPEATVTTGMPAFFASSSWASSSTGLVMHSTIASTLALMRFSIWLADWAMAPPELSNVVLQPSLRAAASAALAARA